jgi:hypothetical protein
MVEQGPIRPPSEFTSLLIRVTRHCPWNACAFCSLYKNERFERRSEDEIIAEIEHLADVARRLKELVAPPVTAGRPEPLAYLDLTMGRQVNAEERRVALWLSRGGARVFLQDADSLILPSRRLLPVLACIQRCFPSVRRITTYARSRTLFARSEDDLRQLQQSGLTRVHVGIESGSDAVLSLMMKGCRAEHHVEGCRRAIRAGLEVTGYVMPGLGGLALHEAHTRDTARVLEAIRPQHIRVRTLWVDRGSALAHMRDDGRFQMPEEDVMLEEIRHWVNELRNVDSHLVSDHDRNLLPRLSGHLIHDHQPLMRTIQAVLSLTQPQRNAFIVARRTGRVATLEEFLDNALLQQSCIREAESLLTLGNGSLVKGMAAGLRDRSI